MACKCYLWVLACIVLIPAAQCAQVNNKLVSRANGETGQVGNFESDAPDMTPDGKFVVFESDATNLVPGLNGKRQIFLRNLQTNTIELISVNTKGAPGSDVSYQAHISADGQFVVFVSSAKDLVANDTNPFDDVFLRDRMAGVTTRISAPTGGGNTTGPSYQPRITGDGRFVLFESTADNLVPGDTNQMSDGFVVDRTLGTIERVTLSSTGGQLSGNPNGRNEAPAISDDGNLIVFQTDSGVSNAVPNDTNNSQDVFLRNRAAQTTVRISVNPVTGVEGNSDSVFPFISRDGGTIVFTSFATNLAGSPLPGIANVYLYRVAANSLTLITNGNGLSAQATVSADGRFVAFASLASNLVAQSNAGFSQQYLFDSQSGTTEILSLASDNQPGNAPSGSEQVPGQANIFCCYAYASTDGRFVAYDSHASNLVLDDTNGFNDVFVHDRAPVVIANAGGDKTVMEGQVVTLDGSRSVGTSFTWSQTAGPTVADATGLTTPVLTFTAPTVSVTSILSFRLVVTSDANVSSFDTANVTDVPSGTTTGPTPTPTPTPNPGGLPTPPGGVVDSNGNGVPVPPSILQQLGIDPNNPNDPNAPVSTELPLTVSALQMKLNFKKANSDSARVTGTLILPAKFTLAGIPLIVYVGGQFSKGSYDAKGRLTFSVSSNANLRTAFKLTFKKPKKGQTFAGGIGKFTLSMQKGSFTAGLGIVDTADMTRVPITVPVLVMINRSPYFASVTSVLTSKHLKGGTIKH